jgi:hypothetical protein
MAVVEQTASKNSPKNRSDSDLASNVYKDGISGNYLYPDHDWLENKKNYSLRTNLFTIAQLSTKAISFPSFVAAKILEQFEATNCCKTVLGKTFDFLNTLNPETDVARITEKQNAAKEIEQNQAFRKWAEQLIAKFDGFEKIYAYYCSKPYSVDYRQYRALRKSAKALLEASANPPAVESKYLTEEIINPLTNLAHSRSSKFFTEALYRTSSGVQPSSEVNFFSLSRRYWPLLASPTFLAGLFSAVTLPIMYGPRLGIPPELLAKAYLTGQGALLAYPIGSTFFKDGYDRRSLHRPYGTILKDDERIVGALSACAKLDQLLGFAGYREKVAGLPISYPTCYPSFESGKGHICRLTEFRSEGLALAHPSKSVVSNDVNLDGRGVTNLSGATSNGKTTLLQALTFLRLRAQTGSPIMAARGTLSPITQANYLVHANTKSGEGQFGSDIDYALQTLRELNPDNWTVMDDFARGAATGEAAAGLKPILLGFHALGPTIFSTHDFELVKEFQDAQIGRFLKMGWNPASGRTFKLEEGVADGSHAKETSDRVGANYDNVSALVAAKGATLTVPAGWKV